MILTPAQAVQAIRERRFVRYAVPGKWVAWADNGGDIWVRYYH